MRFILVILCCIPCLLQAQLPDLIPYKKGNLWGYADSTGRIMLEPQWLNASPFDSNGLAQVGIQQYDYAYKGRYKHKTHHYDETCGYALLMNKKGEYVITHQRIAELMHKYNPSGFSCIDMKVEDTIITVTFQESGRMQFDLRGKLLLVQDGKESGFVYNTNTYAYAFNRQTVYSTKGIYFTDRFLNRKSRLYKSLFEEGWCFGTYYVFKIEGMDGKDTIVNPDGPAALVKYKKQWMFVDTSDHILYKWKDKEEWPDISQYIHPKDSLRYSGLAKKLTEPCSRPYVQCVYPYNRFDTSKGVFANWMSKGVLPTLYDAESRFVNDPKLPYMLVKSDSFYSYMDTFGHLSMPLKYKKLTHFRSYYALAFDTTWHWIDINGKLLSDKHYKTVQRNYYPHLPDLAYDKAWHWIDRDGNILYDEYYMKGYQIVPFTGNSLFFDPKRNLYIDKYGREYAE